ncbi:letm1 and EF-hand domain-containing protein 1, mitochondrial, variant 2 [Balamuthia mandrillaris]
MRGCSGGRAALLLHGRPRHKQLASLGWSPSFAWGSSSSTGPGPLFFSPQLAGSTTNSLFLFSPQSRLFCSTTSSSQDEPQPQREERLSKPPVRPRSAPRPPVPPAPLKLKAKRRRGAATSARKQEQSERKKEAEEHEEENTAQTKQGQGSTSSEVERMPELDAKQYDSAVVYYFTRAKVVVGQVLTHYWNGTKLLYNNITLSRRLVQMQRDGQPISRRDHKLVSRTKKDVKTAIPFLLLLLAPFSAYYLPFIIGFFPRILPSTYLHSSHKEDYQQKQLERRLQLAQRFFLVDSLANKLSSKEEATGIIDAFERCTTEKVSSFFCLFVGLLLHLRCLLTLCMMQERGIIITQTGSNRRGK